MARITLDVKPTPEGAWRVEVRGIATAPIVRGRKREAIAVARQLTRAVPRVRLIIRGRDGAVQTERSYGRGPRRRLSMPGVARGRSAAPKANASEARAPIVWAPRVGRKGLAAGKPFGQAARRRRGTRSDGVDERGDRAPRRADLGGRR